MRYCASACWTIAEGKLTTATNLLTGSIAQVVSLASVEAMPSGKRGQMFAACSATPVGPVWFAPNKQRCAPNLRQHCGSCDSTACADSSAAISGKLRITNNSVAAARRMTSCVAQSVSGFKLSRAFDGAHLAFHDVHQGPADQRKLAQESARGIARSVPRLF